MILGVDYYDEDLNLDKYSERARVNNTHNVDFNKESLGFYIRDEFYVSQNIIMNGGFRTEEATIDGKAVTLATNTVDFNNEKEHDAEAYEAGATYLFPENNNKIYCKYSKGYRFPFLDEQASYWGFGSDEFLLNIEKEESDSYEIGGSFSPSKELKLGLTLFRTDMEDEIAWNSTTNRNENLDETRHEGAEFSLSYLIEDMVSLSGNFTYHKGEFTNGVNTEKEIPLIPKRLVNLAAEIFLPYNISLIPGISYVSESFIGSDNNNSEEPLDSYTLYNLSFIYKPEQIKRNISAFVKIDNITNKEYLSTGYEGSPNGYYPAQERTYSLGLSFSF